MKKIFMISSLAALIFLPLCADEITKLKNDIAEIQAQIMSIEMAPNQKDTLHRLERKLEQIKAKLDNLQTQSSQNPTFVKKTKYNRTGFLLGVGLGTMMNTESSSTQAMIKIKGDGVPLGVRIGFQQFFDTFSEKSKHSPVGFRMYIDYFISAAANKAQTLAIYQGFGAYNLDLLIDFHIPETHTYLGFFSGVGYGLIMYEAVAAGVLGRSLSKEVTGVFYNLGAAITINSRHRLEFLYKFLPKNYIPASGPTYYFSWKSSDFLGGVYQFTF